MPVLVDHTGQTIVSQKPGEAPSLEHPDDFGVPHVYTFGSILSGGWQTYWHEHHDEAMRHRRENGLAMYRDLYLQSLLRERVSSVMRFKWHLESDNPKDPTEKATCDALTKVIRNVRRLRRMQKWTLRGGLWFGRYAAQVKWGWDTVNLPTPEYSGPAEAGVPPNVTLRPQRVMTIKESMPINGDKLGYRWDGTPYILAGAAQAFATRYNFNMIYSTDGAGILLDDCRLRRQFIIHNYDVDDADYFEPEMAGGRFGVGIRSRIYWGDWMRREYLSWVSDTLERIGLGLVVIEYEMGNAKAEAIAIKAAKSYNRRSAIVYPVSADRVRQSGGIRVVEAPVAGAQFVLMLAERIEKQMERYIVGQSMSGGADASNGLGGSGRSLLASDCVPVAGSEILTRSGFKKPHEVIIGEEVLAYDLETDSCRWTPLLNKTFYENRPVAELHNKVFSALCTRDHSWVSHNRWSCGLRSRIKPEIGPRGGRWVPVKRCLKKAYDLNTSDRILLASAEREQTDSLLTPTEAAILGWAITDGQIIKNKRGSYSVRIMQSKEDQVKEIQQLVPARTYEWIGKPTVRTFPTGNTSICRKIPHIWVLPAAASTDLMKKVGYNGKEDLPGIVTRLSFVAREAMLHAMIRAESDASGTFYNKNKHVIEAFDILCALQGHSTGKLGTMKSIGDPVLMKTIKKTRHLAGNYLKLDDHSIQDIWCPTTKYGTWVMRQNGRVMITGNTKQDLIADDAEDHAETLTGGNIDTEPGIVNMLFRWSFPDLWGKFPIRWLYAIDDGLASAAKLQSVLAAAQMGVTFPEVEVRALTGVRAPEEGEPMVGGAQQQPGGMPGQEQGGGQPGNGGGIGGLGGENLAPQPGKPRLPSVGAGGGPDLEALVQGMGGRNGVPPGKMAG